MPEPDFIVGDWELRKVPWKKLRLNGGPLMADHDEGPQDADGVPMRPLGPGGRLVYNPTVLAQQGMKRLDTYVRTGNRLHLRQARKYANVLDELATGNRTSALAASRLRPGCARGGLGQLPTHTAWCCRS